ncbi:MAG TPA: hypothetical protein VGZ22_28515 [Isosphaeraceae bacterium]|jgi:hypothetical protein|nr:hypothetical protein [Isosphaeraceae bacterium]
MELIITASGVLRCVYDEAIDLRALGRLEIVRASHVEPSPDGSWTADMTPLAGPMLGPFGRRSEALTAEQAWLAANWLTKPQ